MSHSSTVKVTSYFQTEMSAMTPQQKKPLTINMGAVKRLSKEVVMYTDELNEIKGKIEKGGHEPDSHEARQLVTMREETDAVLRDVQRKVVEFKGKLANVVKDLEGQGFGSDSLVTEAKQLIAAE